jgi:hypothetical protein
MARFWRRARYAILGVHFQPVAFRFPSARGCRTLENRVRKVVEFVAPNRHKGSMKPFAESCEQNRAPIQAVLEAVFADRSRVLEIASGTGQHAVYFGAALPHLTWQTSELPVNHAGIRLLAR